MWQGRVDVKGDQVREMGSNCLVYSLKGDSKLYGLDIWGKRKQLSNSKVRE